MKHMDQRSSFYRNHIVNFNYKTKQKKNKATINFKSPLLIFDPTDFLSMHNGHSIKNNL